MEYEASHMEYKKQRQYSTHRAKLPTKKSNDFY